MRLVLTCGLHSFEQLGVFLFPLLWRGVMVSIKMLDSVKSSGPDLSSGQGRLHCIFSWAIKTLINSHSASSNPGVLMGTCEYNTRMTSCN